MDHYIDIQVLPDPEFKATTLLNAVYSKLHRALVSLGRDDIGVSFPEAAKAPGSLLRLHSGKAGLENLMALGWLKALRDYTEVSAPAPVPENAGLPRKPSLPDRQLRNLSLSRSRYAKPSLPDRQLRKNSEATWPPCCASLPDRQLRNQRIASRVT